MTVDNAKRSSPAALGLAWAIVVLPTLWGLTYTVENALKLFRNAAAPATTAQPPAVGR